MSGTCSSSNCATEAIIAEIASARRVAAMLTDPRDQATVEQYIGELAKEAGMLRSDAPTTAAKRLQFIPAPY